MCFNEPLASLSIFQAKSTQFMRQEIFFSPFFFYYSFFFHAVCCANATWNQKSDAQGSNIITNNKNQ